MKRLYLLLISLGSYVMLLAQRGRLMPEDYTDYPDYSSSSSDDSFMGYIALVILIIMGIGLLWFKSALSSSRKEDIQKKITYLTNQQIKGYLSAYRASTETSRINTPTPKQFYNEENGVVKIPKYAKCIILEYYKENHSFVKVKFEDYPEPLYIGRWFLRTPADINK